MYPLDPLVLYIITTTPCRRNYQWPLPHFGTSLLKLLGNVFQLESNVSESNDIFFEPCVVDFDFANFVAQSQSHFTDCVLQAWSTIRVPPRH